MADPKDDSKWETEVIDRTEEENGDYSFTFILTPRANGK